MDVMRRRCSDPRSLSDRDLMRAAHTIATQGEWLPLEQISRILRELVARCDLTWPQIAAVTGYPWQTAFVSAHR